MPDFHFRTWTVWALAALALIGSYLYFATNARAADKGGPAVKAAAAEESVLSWTGFGFALQGSLANASADFGAPINISMGGQTAGVMVYYNHQFGRSLVLGIDGSYDRVFGDLHDTANIDYALGLGFKAGVLPTKSTLVYARIAGERVYGSGGHIDGVGIGGGIETKLVDRLTLGLEWMRYWYDHDAFGPSVDISSDRITARAKFDLYAKPVSSVFADR